MPLEARNPVPVQSTSYAKLQALRKTAYEICASGSAVVGVGWPPGDAHLLIFEHWGSVRDHG